MSKFKEQFPDAPQWAVDLHGQVEGLQAMYEDIKPQQPATDRGEPAQTEKKPDANKIDRDIQKWAGTYGSQGEKAEKWNDDGDKPADADIKKWSNSRNFNNPKK